MPRLGWDMKVGSVAEWLKRDGDRVEVGEAICMIAGDKATYNKVDLPTGQWPYNVAVVPPGKIALTADNGGAGSSPGNVQTVSVVDLEGQHPHIIDRVVVGDGPEGLAVSPKGDVAAAVGISTRLRAPVRTSSAHTASPCRPGRSRSSTITS